MPIKYTKPRGTQDIYGKKCKIHSKFEQLALDISKLYGYEEIKVPMFEDKNVFVRTSGESSDVVSKELYDFKDKGDRWLALRPEFTAGIIRAVVENKLLNQRSFPLKLLGIGPVFRYDRPQSGRYRQFDQLSYEVINSNSYCDDVEVIQLLVDILTKININDFDIIINDIGNFETRKRWVEALKQYFIKYKDQLTEDSIKRIDLNPLRILDDKIDGEKDFVKNAPKPDEFLTQQEKENFNKIKTSLDRLGIKYTVDNNLVRGLDYYTNFVFEFKVKGGNSILGGGRYSKMLSEFGGEDLSCVGFGVGVDRIVDLLISRDIDLGVEKENIDVIVANLSDKTLPNVLEISSALRTEGFSVYCDYSKFKLNNAFTISNTLEAKFILIIGEKEINEGYVTVKNQKTLTQEKVEYKELISYFKANII